MNVLLAGLAVAGCPSNKWEQAILDKHNEWRANTQPPAKDMYKVRWDSAIATNMYNWLARCNSNWPHSDQDGYRKNVGGYEFLGENLAYCAGTACEDPIDGIVGYLGQSWWDEKDDYNWASDSSRGGVTSHYTQMSSSNIYAIGCAAVECPSPGPYGWNGKWWEIGCQYGERGQGYWVGTKPFESGSGGLIEPAASLLAKHPDICQAGAPTPPAPTPPAPTPPAPTPPTPPAGTPSGAGCPQNKWEQAILDKHNEWRANTQPPAKDMYKVRWDSAIATNMYNWLARCDSSWPHSDQDGYRKNVGGYEFLGENLAYCAGTACEDPIDGIVGYLGQSWWDEKDDYNWASDSSRGGVTSHYTQMSSSNIYAIGCAAVECPSPGPYGWNGKWWEIGCQYGERGQGYWVGTKPFESGSGGLIEPAASLLAKHPDICQAGAPTPPAPTPPAPTPPAPTPPTPPAGTPSGAGCPQNKWEQAILDKHNEWRANTQPPAKDMYKVRWDSAIATNMYNWLARCDSSWPHSDQDGYRKNVGGYEFLGENLAYCAGTACEDPIDGIVGYLGQSWWDEKDDYNWASDSSRGGVTSHYTQMSSSNIYAIGCAAVECPSPGPYGWNGKWWEIGCQYGERGQGYWVGTKPFESGSGGLIEPAASLLAKHPDICQAGAPTPPAPTPPAPTPPAPTPPTPPAGTPSGAGCPQNKWEQAILDKHNEWRANTQPPAKDMYKVRWDSAIATNMYNWLARCDSSWPHSDQDGYRKNVGGYEFLGENLAYCAGTACEDPIDGIVGYLGQSWWDEKDDYNWASDSSRGGVTSHYTQMSSSNIYAIGCAAVECPSPGPYGWNGKWWEIGCQYGERGQGYWVGTKPFESGSGGLIEPDASLLAKHPDICGAGAPPPPSPPAPTPPAPSPPAPTPPTPPAGTPSGAGCPQNKWEQAILDKHNEWRANTQPPAKDMYKVRWDSAIATNMYNWLARCDSSWPHSDQDGYRKNVGGYEFLGENLAYCAGTACEDPIDGIVGYLGQSWWDEKDDYNWASDSSRGGVTSHYTQMSSSNIYAIGCAAVECPSPGPYGWNGKWWEIGCQYGERGQGYWVGTKPFESGSGGLIEPDASLLAKHPDICGAGAPPPPSPPAPTPPAPSPPAPTPPTPPAGTPSGAGCPQNKWEQAILDKHNEWRANTQPPAKDMYKVRWDSAIATNMYNWLARCDSSWPHSDQDGYRKNVGGYEFLGENLAYCAGTACEDPIDGIVGYLGQSWWDEKDDYNWASDSSRGGVTSHYTQMSSSNIYAIGCAAVECPSPGPYGWNGKWWEIGCQYGERGQGYWVGTKPFERGSGGLIEPDASLLAKHPDICSDVVPTSVPTTAMPTSVPDTSVPTTSVPTTAMPTSVPDTSVPTPSVPTTAMPTSVPDTSVPTPSVPTTAMPTSVPDTSVPTTSVPTTAMPTSVPDTSVPTPSVPTTAMPTSVPDTSVPTTSVPTTAMPTAAPAVVKPTSAPALTTMAPAGSTATPVPGTAVPTPVVKPTSAPALTTMAPAGSTATPVPGTAAPAVVKPTSAPALTTMSPPGSTATPVPGTAVPAPVVKPTSEPALTTMSPPGSTATPVPGTAVPAAVVKPTSEPSLTTISPPGSTSTPVPGTAVPTTPVKPTSEPSLTTMSPPGSTSTPVPGTAVPTTPVKPTSEPSLTTMSPPGSTSTPVPGTAVPTTPVKPTSEPSLTTMSPPGSTSTPVPGTAVPTTPVKPTSEPSLTTMSPPGSTSTPVPGTAVPAAKTPVPTTMAPLGSTATPVPGTDAPAGGYQTISPQLGAGTGDSDDSSTDNWWIWLLVALGVLFACAAVIGAVVMKKRSDEGVQFLDFMDSVDAGNENNPMDPAFEGMRL